MRRGRAGMALVEGRWFFRLLLLSAGGLAAAAAISQVSFSNRTPFQPPGALTASFAGFDDGAPLSGAPADGVGGGPSEPGAGGGAQEATAVERYFAGVLQKVNRHKRYPRREEEERIEGETIVRITVNRTGALVQADILQASPRAGFNREALASVRRANPFPEFPEAVTRDALTFDLRVQFKLH